MYFSSLLLISSLTFVTFTKASPIEVALSGRNVEVPVARNTENILPPGWGVEQGAEYSKSQALEPVSPGAPDWKRETESEAAPDWRRDSAAPAPSAPDWRRQSMGDTPDPLLTGPDW